MDALTLFPLDQFEQGPSPNDEMESGAIRRMSRRRNALTTAPA